MAADFSSIVLRYELFIRALSSAPTRRAVKYTLAQLLLKRRAAPRTATAAKTSQTSAWCHLIARNFLPRVLRGASRKKPHERAWCGVNMRCYQAISNRYALLTFLLFLVSALSHFECLAAELRLTWADNSTDEDGFNIDRKTGITGTYLTIACVGP